MTGEDRNDLLRRYHSKKPLFEQLMNAALADIEAIFEKSTIKYHKPTGRIKSFKSFCKKLDRKKERNFIIHDPFMDIVDIVGTRVVVLYKDDLDKVEELLKPTFNIISIDRKGQNRPKNEFGYDSDHYVLSFNEVYGPHYAEIKHIMFELQARTILMDAWGSISHHLEYKNEDATPEKLKEDLYALSGMFAGADTKFQILREATEKSRLEVQEKLKKPAEFLRQEINLDTIKAYLKYKFPERWDKEEKSQEETDIGYSYIVQEIKNLGGYTIIGDIDDVINTVDHIALKIEEKTFQVSVINYLTILLDLFDDKFFSRHEKLRQHVGSEKYHLRLKMMEDARKEMKVRKKRKD